MDQAGHVLLTPYASWQFERRFIMNREEAATMYLYNLPGFRGEFLGYRQAADTPTDVDKGLLHHAASGCQRKDVI